MLPVIEDISKRTLGRIVNIEEITICGCWENRVVYSLPPPSDAVDVNSTCWWIRIGSKTQCVNAAAEPIALFIQDLRQRLGCSFVSHEHVIELIQEMNPVAVAGQYGGPEFINPQNAFLAA